MLVAISLIPATVFVIIGYFVLFSSTYAADGVKRFGQLLAIWIFLIAGGTVGGGLLAQSTGFSPMGKLAQHMAQMQQVQEQMLKELQKK